MIQYGSDCCPLDEDCSQSWSSIDVCSTSLRFISIRITTTRLLSLRIVPDIWTISGLLWPWYVYAVQQQLHDQEQTCRCGRRRRREIEKLFYFNFYNVISYWIFYYFFILGVFLTILFLFFIWIKGHLQLSRSQLQPPLRAVRSPRPSLSARRENKLHTFFFFFLKKIDSR